MDLFVKTYQPHLYDIWLAGLDELPNPADTAQNKYEMVLVERRKMAKAMLKMAQKIQELQIEKKEITEQISTVDLGVFESFEENQSTG